MLLTIFLVIVSLVVLKSFVRLINKCCMGGNCYFAKYKYTKHCHHNNQNDDCQNDDYHNNHYHCAGCNFKFPLWRLFLIIVTYVLIFKFLIFIFNADFSIPAISKELSKEGPKQWNWAVANYINFDFSDKFVKTIIIILLGLFAFNSITKTMQRIQGKFESTFHCPNCSERNCRCSRRLSLIAKIIIVVLTIGVVKALIDSSADEKNNKGDKKTTCQPMTSNIIPNTMPAIPNNTPNTTPKAAPNNTQNNTSR